MVGSTTGPPTQLLAAGASLGPWLPVYDREAATAHTDVLTTAAAAFVASLLASVIGAMAVLYTARLRRFASEKWWERQATEYVDTLNLLIRMRRSALHALPGRGTEAERVAATEELRALMEELRAVELRGSLLMSESAANAVAQCAESIRQTVETRERTPGIYAGNMRVLTENTILLVRAEAKRDLRVGRR